MGKVIRFKEKPENTSDNLITSKPWEFRWSDWGSKHFIQVSRSQSAKLENLRKETYRKGDKRIPQLPPHSALRDGMACTVRALFTYRDNEEKMREVYYLAGLIDCLVNQVNPLLRTDLIRDMYNKVKTLKSLLNANWYGTIDRVLFPIDARFYTDLEYREKLSGAGTMKELYGLIREGSGEMFDILSLEYVFYAPGRGL